MASRALPGLGLKAFWGDGADGWGAEMDANLRTLSALTQLSVISATTDPLPGAPSDGDIYIVPSGVNANKIALRDNGAWVYLIPIEGWLAFTRDTDKALRFDGSAWIGLFDVYVTEAPADSTRYGRRNAAWVPIEPGMPTGGTTGQVLTKTGDTNYAAAWADAPGAGSVESFSDLNDVPTYTGNAHKPLVVNDTEDGVAVAEVPTVQIGIFIPGLPDDGAKVLVYPPTDAFQLPASLTGARVRAGVAATGTAVFALRKNGSSIGSISITGTTPTITFSSAVDFDPATDVLQIVAPTPQDATLAEISIVLRGTRLYP